MAKKSALTNGDKAVAALHDDLSGKLESPAGVDLEPFT